MTKAMIVYSGLLLTAVVVLFVACGDDEKEEEVPEGNAFDQIDCASAGKDESKCDFALCEAKSEKKDAVAACKEEEEAGDRDEEDPTCAEIGGCYDTFASCYSGQCPIGSDASAANEERVLECEDALNACVVGGDPDDPIDVLDCDGDGTDPDTCNYNACWTVSVAEEDLEKCKKDDGDHCEDIYQCLVDWVVCYSDEACRPGKSKDDLDMEANTQCNEDRDECEAEYKD